MASDVEVRSLTRTLKNIDAELGKIAKGLAALNMNLVALARLIEDKEKGPDGAS